ncbi:hypothetical protein INR49_027103, partial [Caranx melampygus]
MALPLLSLMLSFACKHTGACGVAVGYPLDTVKVRIQTQKQFTGIWQCAVATFSKEGVHGFFKGMSLPITTISMTSSVVFGTYRNSLQCLSQLRGAGGGPNTKLEVFLSGMAGGIAQISVMSPGDIVKVRLQCQTESKRGGTNLPKPKYQDWSGVMLAGGIAGMAGWTVGTPMDVIKARLQMDGAREMKRYKGFLHCISETVRVEGVGVFFRSLGINCLRAFPVNMVVFVTYEVLTSFLQAGPDSMVRRLDSVLQPESLMGHQGKTSQLRPEAGTQAGRLVKRKLFGMTMPQTD